MRIPVIRGIIDRRILVNFHIDADVLAKILPRPFRPKLIKGRGMGGICLIRLVRVHPRFLPAVLGISSENAAHRFAVEWEQDGEIREGVFIPRRDTSSRLNALVGGRLFPGVHHHARFSIDEHDDYYKVTMDSDDGESHLSVETQLTERLPESSVFSSLREASEFFEQGSLGYSATPDAREFDGLELRAFNWSVDALAVKQVESSFFDDESRFPSGSISFDCALLMRQIEHEWHSQPSLCCEPAIGG